MKRTFDIAFSLVGLTLFAAPAIIIACILKFVERHPVLFLQERIGKGRHPFLIIKFQTMVDHKPTPMGALLRTTGLDEVPQFINVLKGDMSIVGPRALTIQDIVRLGWNDQFHDPRWKIKPGITGFAQLYGGQHRKTSWFWDKRYLRHQHVFIDLGIILISFLMNVFGKRQIRRILFQNTSLD